MSAVTYVRLPQASPQGFVQFVPFPWVAHHTYIMLATCVQLAIAGFTTFLPIYMYISFYLFRFYIYMYMCSVYFFVRFAAF